MAATHKGVIEITYTIKEPISRDVDEEAALGKILTDWCQAHDLNPNEASDIMGYTSDEDDDDEVENSEEVPAEE